jgi:hypothetical protein
MTPMTRNARTHALVVPPSGGFRQNPDRLQARLLSRAPAVFSALFLAGLAHPAAAETSNGNDFALYYSEARDDKERAALLDDARNRPHFFRYLQIMEMQSFNEGDRSGVTIIAFEPASRMDIHLTVTKSVSVALLASDPKSKRGDAIAVTGAVINADAKKNMIELGDSIVRHKDRLSPKIGKELLCEVDPGAVFYSYTAGSRPVTLTYQDRDLIRHKESIVKEKGPDGWVEFLEQEVAKRRKNRQSAAPAAE